ncbi:hypothetical protein HRW07_30315 [Streptomyces lunaelactis]|uniref:WXG100 family type VII secretion target n=1 Tax=Streptomyces lunaelactis TaxID=1535768 RepID=UPI0015848F90|nr:hypothetical protein [Streptomyces lunaelactis]NUL07438.1 hypothetical protein [Streptomyces lunaelactis]
MPEGFDDGAGGEVFGHPTSTTGSSPYDYDTWGWRQIMAAILGMSNAVATEANQAHANNVSDPRSLQEAANAFHQVQRTLQAVAKSLTDQARALAGDDGPWKGIAGDAFRDMITNFSRQVQANADVLSGGATGMHSVPQQLANNAVNLANARNKIVEIDNWYANQARRMGVTQMSNGLVPISQRPQLVAMMTEDMRKVLHNLAGHYQVTIDAIDSPTPVSSPLNGSNDPNALVRQDPGNSPDLGDLGGLGDLGDLGGLGSDTGSLSDLSGFPDTGIGGTGAVDGLGGLGSSGDLTGFPGDLSADGIGAGLDSAGLDPSALDSALNPDPFVGGTDVGVGGLGTGNLGGLGPGMLSPIGFGGGTGTGTGGLGSLNGGLSSADPATWGDGVQGAGFPGGTGVGEGPGALGSGLDSGLGDVLSTESGLPQGMGGLGMPFMPGMGGMGAAGGAGNASGERTDASGLLDPSTEPWMAEESADDEVGSPTGAAAGEEGRGLSGMPYLPLGAAHAGAGAGAGGAREEGERPEASALLEPDAEPWAGEAEQPDTEVGSATGAAPGEAVLTAPAIGSDGLPVPVEPVAPPLAVPASAAQRTERSGERSAAVVPPSAGAEEGGGALPDNHVRVPPRPAADDGEEEDISAWETGAGAFVPLLWALPGERVRAAEEPDEDEGEGEGEQRSTWQPDRSVTGTAGAVSTVVPEMLSCGEGGPEELEEPEETAEAEQGDEAEEAPAGRGIADLLVQDESAWGTVPRGSGSAF